MTERQEHILRIIVDPVNGDWRKADRLAVQAACDERADLLAAAQLLLDEYDWGDHEVGKGLAVAIAQLRAIHAKATGGTS